jgi:hypothetical protein
MKSIIPDKALEQHAILLGKTRSGKSSAMRYLVEGQLDRQRRVCIIDPKGDWYGLRSSADGRADGYPVVIFGGEHADVPINQHAGAAVAELVATGNRPCIIDLGGWHVGERTRFYIDFAATLFRTSKSPMHLVIDEVHNFAPQGKIMDPDAGKMIHWSNRLASEGQGKGIILLAASQRPQKVHKDFVTSCETLLAFRVIHPLDRNAIKEWIDGCPDRDKGREVLESLATMPRGEAWVWSPEIGFGPARVKFPKFSTFDSFAAPTGADQNKLKGWADIDLDEVTAKLQTVVDEAKANDPRELKKQVADLKRQLAAQPTTKTETKIVEKPVVTDGQIKRVETIVDRLEREGQKRIEAGQKEIETGQELVRTAREFASALRTSHAPPATQSPRATVVRQPIVQRTPRQPSAGGTATAKLPIGERKTLAAAIQYPDGVTREQLTVLTGYKRSSRDAYVQRLREKQMIEVRGDVIVATDDGVAALPDAEPLPTGEALREYWRGRLPQGELAVFDVLVAAYPNPIAREEIDAKTGYQRSSRDAYLQRMNAKRLIETVGRGEVKASDQLFT